MFNSITQAGIKKICFKIYQKNVNAIFLNYFKRNSLLQFLALCCKQKNKKLCNI